MGSWLVIILGLIGSWQYANLESSSAIQSVLCPLMFGLFLIALLVKIVVLLGHKTSGRSGSGFTGDFGGDNSLGGDGGC